MPNEKKRKREYHQDHDQHHPKSKSRPNGTTAVTHDQDTSKPTAIFHPTQTRTSTLSIALPGSIIANAKSHDQKTLLAGTIARALAVFCVDEVIIFNDDPPSSHPHPSATDTEGYTALSDPSHFLAHILSYLETPPHLRKSLFPMHPNLRTAGNLPSLDMPHHLRAHEHCPFREGVTTTNYSGSTNKSGTEVDVGLSTTFLLPNIKIPPNTRVTLKLPSTTTEDRAAEAVTPNTPRTRGYYWGYTIRPASSLSSVFTESPFPSGYDVSIGTSERGVSLSSLLPSSSSSSSSSSVPKYKHLLLCFGGVAGLETAATHDPDLAERGIKGGKVRELFDYYVNLLPEQGSRTIRTEEAVWCGLMGLQGIVQNREVSETGVGGDEQ